MNPNINEDMMQAIELRDLVKVSVCLNQGANPNYTRFNDGVEPNGIIQPTTPLRLVLFCISDGMLGDEQVNKLGEIGKLLLENGADPLPAMQLAEARYGKYDPNAKASPFMNVWHLIAHACEEK